MSDSAGSYSPVVGMPLILHVDATARWVAIRNDSPNVLHITCGPAFPTSPTQGNSYHMTIQPWSGDNYDVWSEGRQGVFDGVVYLLSTNPGGLASTGIISTRNNVSIDTYPPSETPPPAYSGIARQQDASSQQRVIALPFGAIGRVHDTVTINAVGTQSQTYILAGTPGVPLNPNAPGSPGAFQWVAYLHYIHMSADTQSYELQWQIGSFDTSGGAQFNGEVWRCRVTPGAPLNLAFFVTPEISFSLVSNTATIQAQMTINALSAAGGKLVYSMGFTVDSSTGNTIPVIGLGGGVPFPGTVY